jgi:hypothetical protein
MNKQYWSRLAVHWINPKYQNRRTGCTRIPRFYQIFQNRRTGCMPITRFTQNTGCTWTAVDSLTGCGRIPVKSQSRRTGCTWIPWFTQNMYVDCCGPDHWVDNQLSIASMFNSDNWVGQYRVLGSNPMLEISYFQPMLEVSFPSLLGIGCHPTLPPGGVEILAKLVWRCQANISPSQM